MAMPSPKKPALTKNTKILTKRTVAKKKENLSAKEVDDFMKLYGFSLQEMADLFGVTIQAVMLWVEGTREFSTTNSRLINLFKKYPKLMGEF